RRVMADESHLGVDRRTVEVDVERAHEDADHEPGLGGALAQDVVYGRPDAPLDRDDFLARLDAADVDDGAVGGAQDPCFGRGRARRIAEEPDVPPEKVSGRRAADRQPGEINQLSRCQAPLRRTRTMATPEANGKSITSKSFRCVATSFSQRLTPAWRISSGT